MRMLGMLVAVSAAWFAEKVPTDQLLEMARGRTPGLEQALRDTFGDGALQKGSAIADERGEFLFAIAKQPTIAIDLADEQKAWKAGGLWVYQGKLATGTSHKFTWVIDGVRFGGKNDIAAFGPDSYRQPGVPEGKLAGPVVMESKIYPNMKANVWYYVPAQWDGKTPLAVQI